MTMSKLNPAVLACAVVIISMAAAGCSRLSARTVPTPPPPLDIPAPPPRVVETADVEPPPPGTLVDAPTSGAPSTRQPAPRAGVPKPEPPKPDPAPQPVTDVPPPAEAVKPAATLQTTPPESEPALEKDIRAKLERANRDLSRVDYQALGNPARLQYDQAKRFATQADEAIKQKNYVFARTLADNAANIAAQLAGR
jgi:hypothetical protein